MPTKLPDDLIMVPTNIIKIALGLLLVPPITALATEEPNAQYVAQLYFTAQQSNINFPDILKINPQLDDSFLYDVQRRFVAIQTDHGAVVGGFKGGFIPKAPIGGVLFRGGFLQGSPIIERRDFRALLIEAELAFELCAPVASRVPDIAALRSVVCHVRPAIELPDAALPELAALKKDFTHLRRLLIPTNMAVSHVLLGDKYDANAIDLDDLDVRVSFNDLEIGFRDGALAGDNIWSRVLWIVNEFVLANNYVLSAGQIIMPGALTGLHSAQSGRYVVDYGPLGQVSFQVR